MIQAMPTVQLPGHTHVSAYPHSAAVSVVARRFLAIPSRRQLLDVCFLVLWRLVGCRLALFMSAVPIHGQSCISEWK